MKKNFGIGPGEYGYYRDAKSVQEACDVINAMKGKQLTDKGFMSTSLTKENNYFDGLGVELSVQMPKGTNGFVTSNIGESEFIAARGSKMEIVKAEYYKLRRGDYAIRLIVRMITR